MIHGLGRCPGGGNGNPLQYSCLENPKDRRVWWATGRRVTESNNWATELTSSLYLKDTSANFSHQYISWLLVLNCLSEKLLSPGVSIWDCFPIKSTFFLKKKKISKCDFVLTGEGFGIKQPWIPSTSHHMWIRNLASQTWSPLSEWKLGSDHLQWSLLQQDQH